MNFIRLKLHLVFTFCFCIVSTTAVFAQPATFTQSADTLCYGDIVTFINTSSGTIDSVSWVSAKGFLSYNLPYHDTATVTYMPPGLDTVHLYVFRSSGVDSAIAVVYVRQELHDIATILDSGGVLYITGVLRGNVIWFKGSVILPGITVDEFDPGVGTFGVGCYYAIVSNSAGCLGTTDTTCIYPAGINKISPSASSVFPNPAFDVLNISSANIVTRLTVTNLLGQTVISQRPDMENTQVNVSGLPAGVYFVKVNNEVPEKFVKE